MEPSIYEFPDIFRRVHMEAPGDITREVRFLERVWRRHLKQPVRHVLDIACGDSPHGQIFARNGIRIAGIDHSATMIAAGRSAAAGLKYLRFYRRRIERFRIPEKSFDAALFMSETFPIMTRNRDILAHLESVAAVLKMGGLYCIDIDYQDGIELTNTRRLWRERNVQTENARIEVREYHRPIEWHEGMHSIYELECTIHFADHSVITRDVIPVRYITPPLMELMARASGRFEMLTAYADLSFTRPIAQCYGRWMAVLRRI
ncbi:MAG TPA: class I SAM-dependent methyltransferase [Candidatus Binataceae bacterium]|nr:class I SAM-dependent methyltransferase [Candidatus Binataceae bacterium]